MSADMRLADDLAGLLSERWSCRAFQPQSVDGDVVRRIVAIASQAPSWCNTQPWDLIITAGEETERFRQALSEHVAAAFVDQPDFPFPEKYEGDFLTRRREVAWQLYESVGIEKGDRVASRRQTLKNFSLFDAPHVAIVTTERKLGVYGAVDCGFFVQSFLLAAHSLGVATIPQAAIASQAPFIRKYFDIPENRLVLLGISFGYPDRAHPANNFKSTRREAGEIISWAGEPRS